MKNNIYNENCLDTMSRMKDSLIDLTITSPPYDNLRDYNGYDFDFKSIARELYRVIKNNGILVWVVGDATIKGSETGSSFKQALHFKEIGFNLHDTMIYDKGYSPHFQKNRYNNCFEYMFVFSKGTPSTFNLLREPRTTKGNRTGTLRLKDGTLKKEERKLNKTRVLKNIWHIDTGYMRTTKDKIAYKHPAIFPEKLAKKHILTWTNENDLVYDCFMGSGTTAKVCIENNRNYIGSEISKDYCEIIKLRTKNIIKGRK